MSPGVPGQKRGSFSLEAMLVFVAVMLFWLLVFSGISPQLKGMQARLVEQELRGECQKVTNTIDTLATYGADSIYISITPYFEQSMERGIFFCQDHTGCRCDQQLNPPNHGCEKTISAVKTNEGRTITAKSPCTTHVADWIDITAGGNQIFLCSDVGDYKQGTNFTIHFGSYYEKTLKSTDPKDRPIRNCWSEKG